MVCDKMLPRCESGIVEENHETFRSSGTFAEIRFQRLSTTKAVLTARPETVSSILAVLIAGFSSRFYQRNRDLFLSPARQLQSA